MSNNDINTALYGTNAIFVEELYEKYLTNPNTVDESWRTLFDEFGDSLELITKNQKGASWAPKSNTVIGAITPANATCNQNKISSQDTAKVCQDSINALMLIRAYKVRGGLQADLDPLGLEGHKPHPDLDPATYGFTEKDYDHPIFLGGALGLEKATLREIIDVLSRTYSGKISIEFMHMPSLEQRDWIANHIEKVQGKPSLAPEAKKKILEDMIEFQLFEEFLHVKYPGAKRFSVEGGEASMAAMEKVIEHAALHGVKEIVIGMPHRGRLNVITKVMGRSYASIFTEFQGNQGSFPEELDVSGDVKYHLGTSNDRKFDDHEVHVSLTANPSHLEAVNPVVVGKVRAKQDQLKDESRTQALGLLYHGDAAFAGQGVVPETIALSDLNGYTTGGTIHIIVNNQIGFTTSPVNARKSPYATDVAKIVHAPIFHVNGDHPEQVIFATQLAVEFRQRFNKDVVLDIICYRRHGHNEGDEPSFTQPIMYQTIAKKPTPSEAYASQLTSEGVITQQEFDNMRISFREYLEEELKKSTNYKAEKADWLEGKWHGLKKPKKGVKPHVDTGLDEKTQQKIGKAISSYPVDFNIHKKLTRLFDAKKKMFETGENIDWATAEALAFGSLLLEGHPVRLSGQDSTRGTFSHRHSGVNDQKTGKRYYPLNHIDNKQAHYEVVDSNLSEFAVMGFEYGYSLAEPNALVLWEAQFGDFANGAQVIIDQFISSGEIKWLRMSGLTLLLPHGYEGQGPEHSSARLERYLQLCGNDNMQVANCSTPANYFHILRRQLKRDFRKPLILMTPKSLLRHKKCVSKLEDFSKKTSFKRIIPETEKLEANDKMRKVVLCSGKIYYELLEAREKRNIKDVAFIRIEQYYPFPEEEIGKECKKYKNAHFIWCQEEPKNMGAWTFVNPRIEEALIKAGITKNQRPQYVGRPNSASTAAGYMKNHIKEQQAIIDEALN